ncbi:MAG TPA: hypothetical protein DEP59_02930 [Moraxella sp.]|nr:hypothetical protein [Moraxella sp.]
MIKLDYSHSEVVSLLGKCNHHAGLGVVVQNNVCFRTMNEPFFPIGQKVLALVFALNGKPDKLGFTKAWAI